MAGYVDGFLIPVPKRNLDKYKKLARMCKKVWLEYGAVDYIECISEDVKKGKWTSFPQAVKLKPGEAVVFAWITYKSRAARDRVNKKVMADPRIKKMFEGTKMPFDGKRMIWGGFKSFIK